LGLSIVFHRKRFVAFLLQGIIKYMIKKLKHILWYKQINSKDGALVGGKNASLGEMVRTIGKQGINLPDGFCLTSKSFWYFLKKNKIDKEIKQVFSKFNPKDLKSLRETGKASRGLILKSEFPKDLKKKIIKSYKKLSKKYKVANVDVAVRSSATAEDLATASFAGQMETFLNIKGEEELLKAIKGCIASLFTDRSISYREEKGFNHLKIALSVGIQKMVRSDLGSSGVMFTLDTETGFENVVLINSIWGIGEMVVKGLITPDEFYVHKPTLEKGFKSIIVKNLGRKTKKYIYARQGGLKEEKVKEKDQLRFSLSEKDILTLAQWACKIEQHYDKHQDIEWAKDGKTGQLFIVQSRPETVHAPQDAKIYKEYRIKSKKKPIITGIAIGDKIGIGKVRLIPNVSKITDFKQGEVLVTKMTDPDWVPIMRLASAIITDEGGKTAHAAIVSRELGIPAIVGTENASKILKTGQIVTADCTQGLNGRVFEGKIPFKIKEYDLKKVPKLKTKIMMNIGAPEIAFKSSFLPNQGVGLAREEFIIAEKIRVHPLALYHFNNLKNKKLKKEIEKITVEHKDKKEYFIKELAEGIAQIGAAFYPKEVIVRFSDFKTNEYRNLIGGDLFEKEEANPMLGFRGASRYIDDSYQPAFRMECRAIKRVRKVFGLDNITVMVPFCRTVEEGKKVKKLISDFGLKGIKVYVMCEVPSNVILVDKFLEVFDGMSIGSNDLTQLVLGLDRDNGQISYIGNETDQAVKEMISQVIEACIKKNKYCGICGQGPSDIPEFAEFLQKEGIESISLNPDTIIKTILNLSKQ
jgi:pyruvate,water dikinase